MMTMQQDNTRRGDWLIAVASVAGPVMGLKMNKTEKYP